MVLPEGAAQPCRTDSTLVRYVTPLLQFTNRPYRPWLMRVDAADPCLIAQLDWIERVNTALFRKIDAMFDGP